MAKTDNSIYNLFTRATTTSSAQRTAAPEPGKSGKNQNQKKPRKNKSVPQIRFPGFTEPWVERKFSELYKKVVRKNDLSYGRDSIISVANMYYKADSIVTNDDYLRTYNIFELGDIAFEGHQSKDFAHGRFVENTIGNGIVSHIFDVFKPIMPKYDLYFWKYAINSERLMGNILIRSTKSSLMMNNLVADDFLAESFCVPDYEEQQKIGAYFQNLDNLISASQRELEGYQKLKQGMLQKMFPKEGKTVPEIRFPKFSGPWEKRQLGDEAIKIVVGGDIDRDLLVEEGAYPVIANALTNDGILGYYESKYRIKAPAVTVTGRGDVGHAKARKIDFTPVVRLLVIQSRHDVDFLENGINTLQIITESTGVPQLTVPQLSKYELFFPPTINEEIAIGEYFQNLDNLISASQHEVEGYKKLKEAMLQKMFV